MVLVGCSADSGDDGTGVTTATATMGDTTSNETSTDGESSSTSAGTTETSTDTTGTGSESTTESGTQGTDTSSETGPDCDAPPDCETCWVCARDGACKGTYDTCSMDVGCIPSLYCIETNCTGDGLQQSCADNCCKSCQNTGACSYVDAAITCIEQQCAGLCGDISCP